MGQTKKQRENLDKLAKEFMGEETESLLAKIQKATQDFYFDNGYNNAKFRYSPQEKQLYIREDGEKEKLIKKSAEIVYWAILEGKEISKKEYYV